MDKHRLHTDALNLRKKLGEDAYSPIDVFSLALNIDKLSIVMYPLGDNISGICIKDEDFNLIAINSAMSVGRQRFSLSHELYHLFYDTDVLHSISAKKIGNGDDDEKKADQFASFFLMPPTALHSAMEKFEIDFESKVNVSDVVKLEQHFGMSRQALLYRLVGENLIPLNKADEMRDNVILSAVNLGYDDALYKPLSEDKQFKTLGYYIKKANELYENESISNGRFEQLLIEAFRTDLVFGEEDGGELND